MKGSLLLYLTIFTLIFASCSTEEAVLPTDTNNPDILQELSQSDWQLISCPDHQFLTINGHSECEYMANLSFDNTKVFITHDNSTYKMLHHICFVHGDKLVVSVQDCANTTWRSLFEWDIVNMDKNSMIIDVTVPNLAPAYNQRFTFEKVN